ncbi:MAG: hypothetical protein HOP16_05805 [Acidobacteria bacterium]|nr:hypothetical protein [Acidobacteriota bacterium]
MGIGARWRSRAHRIGEQWTTWRSQWEVERDLEQAVSGSGPIVVGPWLSEVGYEVLYWVPFLRWVSAAYRVPASRFVILSRGGTESWYRDIGSRYVEIFDHIRADELVSMAGTRDSGLGTRDSKSVRQAVKQRTVSDLDVHLVSKAAQSLGLGDSVNVLHPSLMFRWFAPFWSGQETLGFVERHTRHARIQAPEIDLPLSLPSEYVAVKFYGARSLPDDPFTRTQVRALTEALSQQLPIVQLDTGLSLDDHADLRLPTGPRVMSIGGLVEPRTNLAVQTRIIAGARMLVGTCGSLSWLGPLLGVPTVPVFTDDSFLHAHLHVARRVYGRVGGGRFSPLDLTGLMAAGLTIGRAEAIAAETLRG